MTLLESCKAYVESPDSEEARAKVFEAVMNTSADDPAWNGVGDGVNIDCDTFLVHTVRIPEFSLGEITTAGPN